MSTPKANSGRGDCPLKQLFEKTFELINNFCYTSLICKTKLLNKERKEKKGEIFLFFPETTEVHLQCFLFSLSS